LEDQDLDKKVILISLKEIEYGSMDWIYLAQHRDQWRVLTTIMNYQVLYNAVKFLALWWPIRSSRTTLLCRFSLFLRYKTTESCSEWSLYCYYFSSSHGLHVVTGNDEDYVSVKWFLRTSDNCCLLYWCSSLNQITKRQVYNSEEPIDIPRWILTRRRELRVAIKASC
jgi:hypothetical protein